MAEYLKNNPIALRHCLLYVFLQKSSVKKAFAEFCEVIGKNHIKEDELEFWFDKFKNGFFDNEKEKKSITDMRDILRSDKYALRACIFYESLKFEHSEIERNHEFIHHPVFSVYMHFCKVIGDDVMKYREFDFWFYRFFNGEFDLNFERDKNKKIYELVDMPLDIMKNIVEYLDIIDRMSLERTSQSLRLFSQDQKLFHGHLKLETDWNNIYISFGKDSCFHFLEKFNNCVTEFNSNEKLLRNGFLLKQTFKNFNRILKNPKLYLHTLTISVRFSWKNSNSLEGRIVDALKFTHLMHVKHLNIVSQSMKPLLNILPSLKPGHLTTITLGIYGNEVAMEKVIEMEQWKQAKYTSMRNFSWAGQLRHLCHFNKLTVNYENWLEEDAREMKEILLKSPILDECYLASQYPLDQITIMLVFGGPIEGSRNICHYPIPGTTDYFEIIVEGWNIAIERKKT